VRLAAGRTVLEIGSYLGFSTIAMAKVAKRVWAVDWHRGDLLAGLGDTLPSYWANLARAGVRSNVVTLVGDVAEILPRLQGSFEFIFIDGDHRYEAVRRDIQLCLGFRPDGGPLALHDYGREEQPGSTNRPFEVTRAATELLGPPSYLVETLAVYTG
jgi:Methyltransferase domain